jgi:hypothetical protein
VHSRLIILAAVAGLALSGCSGGSSGGNGVQDVAAPAGVSVSVLQYRLDYAIRHMQIKVTNGSKTPITVSGVRLASKSFTADAVWMAKGASDSYLINPGDSTDFPVALAPSACPGDPATQTGTVQVNLRQSNGTTVRTTPLPARDPFGSIGQVHSEDCRRTAAFAIADIVLVNPLRTRTVGKQLVGELDLRLTPSGKPGTLELNSIGGTTLLDPPDGVAWQIHRSVSAATGPQTVTLELHPARCDPHAIAEDKLGSVLPLNLNVDGGANGIVTVPAVPDLRNQIQNFVQAACRTL